MHDNTKINEVITYFCRLLVSFIISLVLVCMWQSCNFSYICYVLHISWCMHGQWVGSMG